MNFFTSKNYINLYLKKLYESLPENYVVHVHCTCNWSLSFERNILRLRDFLENNNIYINFSTKYTSK